MIYLLLVEENYCDDNLNKSSLALKPQNNVSYLFNKDFVRY